LLLLLFGIQTQVHACAGGGTAAQKNLGQLLLKTKYRGISCTYLGTPYNFANLKAHAGIDYPAAAGTAVYAPMSGTLRKSDTSTSGDSVYYNLGNNKKLFIHHLKKYNLKKYETVWVNKGDKIAEIYKDHVHAELRVGYSSTYLVGGASCGGTCTYSQIAQLTDDPSSVIQGAFQGASKPASPTNLTATARSNSSIKLTWRDNSNNESGFYIYRWNGSSWSKIKTVGANTTSYTNTRLNASTAYYYTVSAYNSAGENYYSSYKYATTSSGSSSGVSGSSWNGKDPHGTACEADARTIRYRSNYYGRVELRWSNTCKTNWTRISANRSSYRTEAKVQRSSDRRIYTNSGTGSIWTRMVYAPNIKVCASGKVNGYTLSSVCY
jgi:hypothetical protein